MMSDGVPVSVAVQRRISTRSFDRTKVITEEQVRKLLNHSRFAPSGGNLQPWKVYVLAGKERQKLTNSILEQVPGGGDYEVYPKEEVTPPHLYREFQSRRRRVGAQMYALMGIGKDDKKKMTEAIMQNFDFFGAPVGLIVTVPKACDKNGWGHVGMFLQTFCLIAEEQGLATCMQEAFGMYSDVVYNVLNINKDEETVWCGVAVGYADVSSKVNSLRTERADVDEFAHFRGFTQSML